MTSGPSDLALVHLEKLKTELRHDLTEIEEKIAEIESETVVKRNRIDELACVMGRLSNLDELIDNGSSNGEVDLDAVRSLRDAHSGLMEVLGTGDCADSEESTDNKVSNVLSAFRSRIMNTINAVDLVLVAVRKQAEVEKQLKASSSSTAPGTQGKKDLGSSAIIRSQELERHRIAREIHDGPAQAIANVVLRMDILGKVYEKDPNRVPEELGKMKAIAQGSLDEIRGFIFDLRPMTLQDLGLVATIKRIVGHLKDLSGLNVRLVVEGEEVKLGQLVTLTVFRIAQEAMNNLKKYSKCETAWVHLKFMEDKVILIVEDDGVGFKMEEVAQSDKKFDSFGLLGMQERADDINAELEITSGPGEGTKVVLVVPLGYNPALSLNFDE